MKDGFAELILTGTVRSFYGREKADAFAAEVTRQGYNVAITEQPGEDLRWCVMALNERAPDPVPPAS
ncbi:MAG: hypothetical protein ACI8TX_002908 [Hyphomicrobiaceae bacterium]